MGMRPVAEMQFADFISCAWDHLVTVAAKQRYRAGTPVPIVVRLPSGGGFSGGPFHSQNPESDGVSVEILDLRTIMPWDRKAVLASVEKTSKVLVLHEDTRTGGFGAEIAATIAEDAFEDLDAPVKRIAAPDTPVPFSPALEKVFIPQVEDVITGLRELAEY